MEEWLASDARQLTQTENEFLAASKTLRNAETRQRKRAARRLVLFSWLATAAAAIAVVMWFRASAANEKERAAVSTMVWIKTVSLLSPGRGRQVPPVSAQIFCAACCVSTGSISFNNTCTPAVARHLPISKPETPKLKILT